MYQQAGLVSNGIHAPEAIPGQVSLAREGTCDYFTAIPPDPHALLRS